LGRGTFRAAPGFATAHIIITGNANQQRYVAGLRSLAKLAAGEKPAPPGTSYLAGSNDVLERSKELGQKTKKRHVHGPAPH